MKRELVYMDAKSSKFWNIEQEGSSHTVTYGRIGTAGQSSTKSFPDEAAAKKDAEKLIKEKLGKGYSEAAAASAGEEGGIPLIAFTSINHKDEIGSNAGTFVGQKVVDYSQEKPAKAGVAYRFRSAYDEEHLVPNLTHYLASPAAAEATAIVIGCWSPESCDDPAEVVTMLAGAKLPKLRAIYMGDIVSEENEMSWIKQTDLSPFLQAYPDLEVLRSRGGDGLKLTQPQHAKLRGLAMESGGMDVSVIRSVGQSDFPNLEYLELWLGHSDYGATTTVEDLQPLLSGRLFPKLKYLGLRNSEIVDDIAAVVVNSPLVERIETLDLSLGMLTDVGGNALLKLKSPTLKRLNLHYNYLTPEVSKALKALPLTVDTSRPAELAEEDDWQFVAVGE